MIGGQYEPFKTTRDSTLDINVFTASVVDSPFELGGLEFHGSENSFTSNDYSAPDLHMVFLYLPDLSFAIRQRRTEFRISSGIALHYSEPTGRLLMNSILIERVTRADLLNAFLRCIDASISTLKAVGIPDNHSVTSDLRSELISIRSTSSS